MFCSKCGKEVQDNSVYCQHCGNKTNLSESASDNSEKVDDVRMTKLKEYRNLKYCTCLECGYSGLMGVVRNKPFSMKESIIVIIEAVICLLILVMYANIIYFAITCLVIYIFNSSNRKKILFCPNCENEIAEN